jgi:hypothetical protein
MLVEHIEEVRKTEITQQSSPLQYMKAFKDEHHAMQPILNLSNNLPLVA